MSLTHHCPKRTFHAVQPFSSLDWRATSTHQQEEHWLETETMLVLPKHSPDPKTHFSLCHAKPGVPPFSLHTLASGMGQQRKSRFPHVGKMVTMLGELGQKACVKKNGKTGQLHQQRHCSSHLGFAVAKGKSRSGSVKQDEQVRHKETWSSPSGSRRFLKNQGDCSLQTSCHFQPGVTLPQALHDLSCRHTGPERAGDNPVSGLGAQGRGGK